MNNFEFCNPVKVVFGKGSIARLSALIPEGSKVLMVYGGLLVRHIKYPEIPELPAEKFFSLFPLLSPAFPEILLPDKRRFLPAKYKTNRSPPN